MSDPENFLEVEFPDGSKWSTNHPATGKYLVSMVKEHVSLHEAGIVLMERSEKARQRLFATLVKLGWVTVFSDLEACVAEACDRLEDIK